MEIIVNDLAYEYQTQQIMAHLCSFSLDFKKSCKNWTHVAGILDYDLYLNTILDTEIWISNAVRNLNE